MMEVFNREFEKLAQSYRRLEQHAAQLQRELDQKRRMALLGEVSAAIAHEIRNPLGGIQIYVERLRRDLGGDAERTAICDKVLEAVRKLDRFVENILTYAGDVRPRRVRIRLRDVLERAADLAGGGVRVADSDAGEIEADPVLLERALINLMRNALEAGGPVDVEARREPDGVVVRVLDRGPGIAPEVRQRLFTPFVTTKAGGTGLGLPLALKMIEAHGGRIGVADRVPPPGTVFEIRLPA